MKEDTVDNVCGICGKGPFKNSHGLTVHMVRAHPPKKASIPKKAAARAKAPKLPEQQHGGSFGEAILALTIKRDEHFQAINAAIEVLKQLQKG